jgi:hypothetical protein
MSGCWAESLPRTVDRVLVHPGQHRGVGQPKLPAPALTPELVHTTVTLGAAPPCDARSPRAARCGPFEWVADVGHGQCAYGGGPTDDRERCWRYKR